MQVFAMIVGLDDFAMSAMIEPHETIATLFGRYEQKLVYLTMSHQFTAGYSIVHTRRDGFSDDNDDDPDYIGMQNGDPDVVAKYLTPAARLNPSKTMGYYFGAGVKPDTISIALTWPAEFTAHEKRERELGRIEAEELAAKERDTHPLPSMWPPPTTEASTRIAPNDHQISPPTVARSTRQWLASCFPLASRSFSNIVRRDDDAKKND